MKDFLRRVLFAYFSRQFIYFLFAGGVSAIVNLSVRVILRSLSLGLISSFYLAWISGFSVAFFLYKRFVFPLSSIPQKTQAIRFVAINVLALPFSSGGFYWLNKFFIFLNFGNFSEFSAHFMVIGMPAIINFILYKFFAFK